jgi:lysozyme
LLRWLALGATFAGMNGLTYSQSDLELTEAFEGCVLTAYNDAGKGILTIGYGHTGSDVVPGLVWTKEQAQTALLNDIAWASKVVNHFVVPTLEQHQFDALVDFVFNAGTEAFENSTLLRLVNAGNMQAADLEFGKWVHAGGKVLSGLVRRRAAEAALFNSAS